MDRFRREKLLSEIASLEERLKHLHLLQEDAEASLTALRHQLSEIDRHNSPALAISDVTTLIPSFSPPEKVSLFLKYAIPNRIFEVGDDLLSSTGTQDSLQAE